MSSIAERVIDGAHGVRLEFDDVTKVPRLFSADHFGQMITNPLYRAAYPWDRAIPYRRVVLCPRFTLNLSTA